MARPWTVAWGVPGLESRAKVEWSHRMSRSLGRCYPDRHLVRIAAYLRTQPDVVFREVLCHELAHLAVAEIYGSKARPHGREWSNLMRRAGFEPRVRMPTPAGAPQPRRRKPRRRLSRLYLHRCPVCHRSRVSAGKMRRWRCGDCLAAGLDGLLAVFRLPPLFT